MEGYNAESGSVDPGFHDRSRSTHHPKDLNGNELWPPAGKIGNGAWRMGAPGMCQNRVKVEAGACLKGEKPIRKRGESTGGA